MDDEFERSRGRAREAYDQLRQTMVEDRTGEKALQKVAELKTGREVRFPKPTDLPAHWARIPGRSERVDSPMFPMLREVFTAYMDGQDLEG